MIAKVEELLAQRHRHRILKLRAPDLEHVA
jgi:hypothetical protein